jgi:DNA helicase-2/ATP-dependent DNA helicase PcrA
MKPDLVPSPFQLAIFEDVAHGTGNTVVKAVAGSGKTTTLEHGLAHVPAGLSVIFMAFNTKITEELAKRAPKGVEVRGLHSYGVQAVNRRGRLPLNKFRVEDLAEALSVDIAKNLELRDDLCDCVAMAKAKLARDAAAIDAIIDEFGYPTAQNGSRDRFIANVLQLLKQCADPGKDGCINYDDMIWLPIVRDLPQKQYDRVFIDETQDLNAAQIELTLRAVKPGGRIVAVGDPKQGIYRFRGADDRAFENVVAKLDAKVLPLSVCYRCARDIVRVAQEIVPEIEAAPSAESGEVKSVLFQEMKRDVRPGDFVLSRTNAPLVSLCLNLLAEGRSAMIQGRDVGQQLASLVKKAKAPTVEALRNSIEEWGKKECARLAAKKRDVQPVEDKVACILAISEGAASVQDVLDRIAALFADASTAARIVLSSTHRAKGLERDRVWLLADTYRRRPEVEEDNLWYVAVTRARKVLVLVEGLR